MENSIIFGWKMFKFQFGIKLSLYYLQCCISFELMERKRYRKISYTYKLQLINNGDRSIDR